MNPYQFLNYQFLYRSCLHHSSNFCSLLMISGLSTYSDECSVQHIPYLNRGNRWNASFIPLHIQAWIQLLKEVSQTKFQSFPLQLSEYYDLHSLSSVLHHQFHYIRWVHISARSVEKCTSMETLSTLNTDNQSCKTSINLQPAK